MRYHARRRSAASIFVWSAAFAAIVLLMAFRFGWWPEDAHQSAETTRQDGSAEPARHGGFEPLPYEPTDVDPVVFTQQHEPDVIAEPFDRPENSSGDRRSESTDMPSQSPFGVDAASLTSAEPAPLPAVQPPARELFPENEASIERYSRSRSEDPAPSAIIPVANFELAAGTASAATEIPATADAELDQIDAQVAAGEYQQAHKALSKIYWNQPERRPEIQERIDRTALLIYFSPQPHVMPPYVIQPGDLLSKVATKYSVPWEYLARLNRVDPQRMQAGQRLKVIKGPFSAIVDLDRFELIVHAHGYYVRRFDVGIGKDHSTPTGKFTVQKKEFNPTYYGTDEQTGRRFMVERDDPQNPLGERWIDLGDSYGIHGTIDPDSIGKAESRGCIRLRNEDVEIVYDLLSVGSEVVIQR